MANRFWSASKITDAGDVDKTIVIPPRLGKVIKIRTLRTIGAHATDSFLRMFTPGDKGKTVTNTAAAANAGDLQLAGDAALNDTLKGEVYAANDWVLVKLDTPRFFDTLGSWQLMLIASVGGATAGTVDLATLTATDGENDPQNAVASGNTAYLMLDEDVFKLAIGTGTTIFPTSGQHAIYVGKPSHPVVLSIEAGAAVAHEMQVTAEYVDA